MKPDPSTASVHYRSPLLAAFGVVLTALMFALWFKFGETYSLLAALAFAAMAPTWYVLPISFTASLSGAWKHLGSGTFPKWAQGLTLIGVILLYASLWLRWAA